MEKINLVEILKDCPRGMELNCTSYNNVSFDKISDDKKAIYPIFCYITDEKGNRSSISFTEDGCESKRYGAKCVIFPKGRNTWKGFVSPPKFKAGDVIISEAGNIVLFSHIDSENVVYYHCIIPTYGNFRIEENTKAGVGRYYDCVLANEQQRQKMYDRIKYSGYKYNQQLNKLEKLIEPKFKIGDKIISILSSKYYTVVDVKDESFYIQSDTDKFPYEVTFKYEKYYDLVPDKFDVTTLKPFDKVLVRNSIFGRWKIEFFEKFDKGLKFPFICMNGRYSLCIPYENNKHLHDTINPCDDYYKI